jgi:hypothetical protein
MLPGCRGAVAILDSAAHDMVEPDLAATRCIRLDDFPAGIASDWLAAEGVQPQSTCCQAPFNIIYSSGTTGAWALCSRTACAGHVQRGSACDCSPDGTTLLATHCSI